MSVVQDSFKIDWLFISTLLSITIFITTCTIIFYRIRRFKPELLKGTDVDCATTYNWNLVLHVVSNCIALAGGMFVIMNVILFILFSIWYIDARSVIVLVVAFAILLLKSFDRFYTKVFAF
jgi:hypothetical protein